MARADHGHFTVELGLALRVLGSDLIVYGSGSVDLTDDSVPEPDVSVGVARDGKGLPLAKLRLAVEVSDSTLDSDLGRKAILYARAGVPEYRVVDHEGGIVHHFWQPAVEGYVERLRVRFGDRIGAATVTGLQVQTLATR